MRVWAAGGTASEERGKKAEAARDVLSDDEALTNGRIALATPDIDR